MIKSIAPWIALAIVGVAFAATHIATSFINGEVKVLITNPLEIRIEKDHPPAPVIHYHIKKEGVWGV